MRMRTPFDERFARASFIVRQMAQNNPSYCPILDKQYPRRVFNDRIDGGRSYKVWGLGKDESLVLLGQLRAAGYKAELVLTDRVCSWGDRQQNIRFHVSL